MKVIGIVVEYNPFHNGHLYQIEKIKELYKDLVIVIAMSGNYTERGEISIIDKWDKTLLALNYGVDAVLEIPYVFSTQSADTFAYAAINMLANFGIDILVFGSESNNLEKLVNAARVQINNPSFDELVKSFTNQGLNYPTSLSKAILELTGEVIKDSNDILAVSYIKEVLKNNYNINILPIKRTNSYLDTSLDDDIVSATNIRKKIDEGQEFSKHVPSMVPSFIRDINYGYYFKLLKYKIISERFNLSKYHLVDDSISSRIYKAAVESDNFDDLVNKIKSKRYTVLRVKRVLLNIFTGFTKEEALKFQNLEYIRVLGLSEKGRKHFKKIKNISLLPIITKFGKYEMLQVELKASILYSILLNDQSIIDNEIKKHVTIL